MGLGRTVRSATLTLLLLALAGSANAAGYWEAEYDLAPDSENVTTNGGGQFVDKITGSLTIRYYAISSGGPLLGARLVAGHTDSIISQDAGIIQVTGETHVVLDPQGNGTPGTLSGDTLNLAVVADHTLTGFLHCGPDPSAICSAVFMTPASNNVPQNDSGAFSFPDFVFGGGTAGVGDFTSTVQTMTPLPTVTTMTTYVGREVSRVWVDAVWAPTMGVAGSGLLVAGLLFSGFAGVRRTR